MVVASGTNSFAKEMAIRKRIANIYNKREEDFPSLKEYNDYLEYVEDMTVNLVDGIDVPNIEAKISQYQKENAEQIMNSQARKAEEYAAALAASKGISLQPDTDMGVSQISEGDNAGGGYAPTVAGGAMGQPRPTGQPVPIGSGGDDEQALDYDNEEMIKLRAERGKRAGGWSVELSKKRAIEEAFSSIWI